MSYLLNLATAEKNMVGRVCNISQISAFHEATSVFNGHNLKKKVLHD